MVEKGEIIEFEGRRLRVIEIVGTEKSKEELEFEKGENTTYGLDAVKQIGYALLYVVKKRIFMKILSVL